MFSIKEYHPLIPTRGTKSVENLRFLENLLAVDWVNAWTKENEPIECLEPLRFLRFSVEKESETKGYLIAEMISGTQILGLRSIVVGTLEGDLTDVFNNLPEWQWKEAGYSCRLT